MVRPLQAWPAVPWGLLGLERDWGVLQAGPMTPEVPCLPKAGSVLPSLPFALTQPHHLQNVPSKGPATPPGLAPPTT